MAAIEFDTGTKELLCEIENRVATITLNRPDKRNALSDRLTPALRQTLLEMEADTRVGCIIITGAGTAFCAGGDVSGMGQNLGARDAPAKTPEDKVRALQHKQATLTERLFNLAKPTIASLPGPAAGAGLSIALACDLRIAADSAFITTAFKNIGLSGDYGGSWLLTQLVGVAKAKELYFTAERVKADRCEQLGIVNKVVPFDELGDATREMAQSIADGPPVALRFMKDHMNRAVSDDLRTCLDREAEHLIRCAATEDHKEAVQAFLTKRRPVFTGT